jgi:hypothetical protein
MEKDKVKDKSGKQNITDKQEKTSKQNITSKHKKPAYCINDLVKSCNECPYVNYGMDCKNNKVRG